MWAMEGAVYVGFGCVGVPHLPKDHPRTVRLHIWKLVEIQPLPRRFGEDQNPRKLPLSSSFVLVFIRCQLEHGSGFRGVHPQSYVQRSRNGPQGSNALGYHYFADTVLWEGTAGTRSQFITRGFPSCRCCAQPPTDQDNGRTDLFGGYINSPYTPTTRKVGTQCFGDIWELCVDLPGCNFREGDFEGDIRSMTLGPWRTCFHCGSTGRWKVCAGTCRNTDRSAFFCGPECHHSGWKEHKRVNGCRNPKSTKNDHPTS